MKKDSREKLVAYQHLFYHLQVNPHYISTLIYGLPNGQTSKFFEDVLFTLFNYGSNDRDNYLLLNVLKMALEEEIRSVAPQNKYLLYVRKIGNKHESF